MTEVWYQNPEVLLNNLDEFIPNNKLLKPKNINSIARFAIYLSIILILLKQDNRWLLIPLLLLFISYYLNINNNFLDNPQIKVTPIVTQSSINPIDFKTSFDNPFMNYITNNNNNNIVKTNTFPQLLPKILSINSDPIINLNNFVKNESFLNIPTNPLSSKIISNKSIDSIISNSVSDQPQNTLSSISVSNQPQNTSLSSPNNSILLNHKLDDPKYILTNTINYDLCITTNDNKSCSPDNKITEDSYNLPNKFKINKELGKEIRKNYRSHLKFDSIDMWGKLINDRNYYTTPNIEIVNDQTGFAEWCYTNNGGSGKCKMDGSNCVKDRDVRYHKGRISKV